MPEDTTGTFRKRQHCKTMWSLQFDPWKVLGLPLSAKVARVLDQELLLDAKTRETSRSVRAPHLPVEADWPSERRVVSRAIRGWSCAPEEVQMRIVKSVCTVWRGIRASVGLLAGTTSFGKQTDSRRLRKATSGLLFWLVLVMTRRGHDSGLKSLKAWAGELRWQLTMSSCRAPRYTNKLWAIASALSQQLRGRKTLYEVVGQLSFIGRSLPASNERETIAVALEEHRDLVTSVEQATPGIVESIRTYACRWANRHRPSSFGIHEVAATQGASLGHPRSSGGHGGHLCSLFQEAPEMEITAPEYCLGHEFQSMVQDARVRDVLRNRLIQKCTEDPGWIPDARAQCLCETGVKTRVITVGDEDLVPLGQTCRQLVYDVLRRDPTVAPQISGKVIEGLRGAFERGYHPDLTVVSTDMKVASDGIYMNVFQAAWEGICDALSLSAEVRQIGLLCTGPQRITYRIRGVVETVVSSRGSMMGNPLTFALLNVVHGWAADEAVWRFRIASTPSTKRRAHLCAEGPTTQMQYHPYLKFGDDLIALWPARLQEFYGFNLTLIGASTSPMKHFVTTPLTLGGQRIGWFCEKMYIFSTDQAMDLPGKGSATRADIKMTAGAAFPLTGFVHLGCTRDEAGVVQRGFPGFASVGATVESFRMLRPDRELEIANGFQAGRPTLAAWFRNRGFIPYLPNALGGAGLLHPKGRPLKHCAPPLWRKALAILFTSNSANTDWLVFERIWTGSRPIMCRQMAAGDVHEEIEAGNYVFARKGVEVPLGLEPLHMTRQEFEQRATHFRRKSYYFMFGHQAEESWKISPTKLATELKKAVEKLVKSWPGVNPIKNQTDIQLLEHRRAFLQSTVVLQTIVDHTGEVIPLPDTTTLLTFVHEYLPYLLEDDGGFMPGAEAFAYASWYDHHVPRRRTILGGERSEGSLFRYRAFAELLGWDSYLFRDGLHPAMEGRRRRRGGDSHCGPPPPLRKRSNVTEKCPL